MQESLFILSTTLLTSSISLSLYLTYEWTEIQTMCAFPMFQKFYFLVEWLAAGGAETIKLFKLRHTRI
jgi:hypothetical protein